MMKRPPYPMTSYADRLLIWGSAMSWLAALGGFVLGGPWLIAGGLLVAVMPAAGYGLGRLIERSSRLASLSDRGADSADALR